MSLSKTCFARNVTIVYRPAEGAGAFATGSPDLPGNPLPEAPPR